MIQSCKRSQDRRRSKESDKKIKAIRMDDDLYAS